MWHVICLQTLIRSSSVLFIGGSTVFGTDLMGSAVTTLAPVNEFKAYRRLVSYPTTITPPRPIERGCA